MPSAPAAIAISAAFSGSGCRPPRALRTVATWSMLMPRRMGGLAAIVKDWSNRRAGGFGPDSPVDPLGIGHDLLRAQLRDDRGEVLEVVDFEVDGDLGEVR